MSGNLTPSDQGAFPEVDRASPPVAGLKPDQGAEDEDRALYSKKALRRNDQTKAVHHYCGLGLTVFGAVILGVTVGVFVTHLLVPEHSRWLSPSQLSELKSWLISGGIGTALGRWSISFFGRREKLSEAE